MTGTGKRVKVSMAFTAEIDAEDWTRAYGAEGRADIRTDVRSYFENQVKQAACWDEVEGEVTWRS